MGLGRRSLRRIGAWFLVATLATCSLVSSRATGQQRQLGVQLSLTVAASFATNPPTGCVVQNLSGEGTVAFDISGLTSTGALITFYASTDSGAHYRPTNALGVVPSTNADGKFSFRAAGHTQVAVCVTTTAGSGSATISTTTSASAAVQGQAEPVQLSGTFPPVVPPTCPAAPNAPCVQQTGVANVNVQNTPFASATTAPTGTPCANCLYVVPGGNNGSPYPQASATAAPAPFGGAPLATVGVADFGASPLIVAINEVTGANINSQTTTQVIAAPGSGSIYVTSFSIIGTAVNSAENYTLVGGTGINCAVVTLTSGVALHGPVTNGVQVTWPYPLGGYTKFPAGSAVCVTSAGTTPGAIPMLSWANLSP